MTTRSATASQDTRSDAEKTMSGIEHDHFGQCMWQSILPSRTLMIEMFHYPKAKTYALVVKHFEKAIPRAGAGKPWPKMEASYVYLPVDDTNTWVGLEQALTALETKAAV